MSRFREEVAVIPGSMWALSICSFIGLATFLAMSVVGEMPGALRYVFRIGLPLIVSFYLLMTGYVYGDARRRGMRAFMWALLAFLIPNAIGFILYFVMREPLMRTCRQCGKLVSGQFAFCPNCGASRAPSCPNCRAAVEADWPHCAHCGTALKRAG